MSASSKRRPGRPEVGGAIHVRLGDLVGQVDEYAHELGITRASAVRVLIATGLLAHETRVFGTVTEQRPADEG